MGRSVAGAARMGRRRIATGAGGRRVREFAAPARAPRPVGWLSAAPERAAVGPGVSRAASLRREGPGLRGPRPQASPRGRPSPRDRRSPWRAARPGRLDQMAGAGRARFANRGKPSRFLAVSESVGSVCFRAPGYSRSSGGGNKYKHQERCPFPRKKHI